MRPGLGRIQEKSRGQAEASGGGRTGRLVRRRKGRRDRRHSDDRHILGAQLVVPNQVALGPVAGDDHHLRLPAEGAVCPLPPATFLGCEELRKVDVLEVPWLVQRGNVGQERPLEREVHDSNARPLDGPVGFRDVGPGEDFSDPSPCGAGRRERLASSTSKASVPSGRGSGRRQRRGPERVSAPAEVGREPAIRAGIGQKQVILDCVIQPRKAPGEPDHELLDASGVAVMEARIEPDPNPIVGRFSRHARASLGERGSSPTRGDHPSSSRARDGSASMAIGSALRWSAGSTSTARSPVSA